MNTVMTTFLCIVLFVAAMDVAWSIRALQKEPVVAPAVVPVDPTQDPPIQFEEAHRRYVDHLIHTKYKDRLPLEAERVERHLKIIKEQLAVQHRIIEEAMRHEESPHN